MKKLGDTAAHAIEEWRALNELERSVAMGLLRVHYSREMPWLTDEQRREFMRPFSAALAVLRAVMIP